MFEKYPLIVSRYEELSEAIVQPDIIADTARYQAYLKERAALEEQVTAWQSYQSLLRHREQAQEMLSDPDLHEMAAEELQSLAAQIAEKEQQLRILLLPRDPDDDHSIIMEIRGGAGGEESCLFAAELMRMYIRYAERHHFRVEPISTTETELGGIKEAVFSIAGSGVFARMKYESGVHRVQRVPITESNGKIQSSTCTVAVLPEAEDVELQIDPKDLRIDVYRSTGHGGQCVNTTDSAVRITHLPTGLVVTCQDQKSQLKNRDTAMQVLRSRLLAKMRAEKDAAYAENRRVQVGTGDRSERIRTYNFPQNRVTDHRIGLTLYKLEAFMDGDMDELIDALILADLGAFMMAGKYAPHCQRHVSTQQSVANYACAQSWFDLGASRVVLARELSLREILGIRERVSPELELETFCHGAMCVSYSGRCLLSNYMTGRDSNRGACAQPCRYQYALMEEKRPGEYFPVFEDEKGTYILNSRDMCMIDHLNDLMDAGVDCIKIEGRAKSAYYAAIVTGAYRHCIDDVAAGKELDPIWRDEVDHISHRIYSTGFYYGEPGQYVASSRYIREWQIVAKVESCDENGLAVCRLNNKFRAGDALEVVGPDVRPFPITAPIMADLEGNPVEEPRTPQMKFTIQLPKAVPPMSMLRRSVDLSAK